MRKLIILSSLLLASIGLSQPTTSLKVDETRLVKIIGPVDGNIIENANELTKLSSVSNKPIYILVNSPGGSIMAGEVFISAMDLAKHRGITIKCVTSVYAASMAFSILMACSERYVLPNTKLLFHPSRVNLRGTMTSRELAKIAEGLAEFDTGLKARLIEQLGIAEDIMLEAFYGEKWWKPSELQAVTKEGWLNIIVDVNGIEELFIVR